MRTNRHLSGGTDTRRPKFVHQIPGIMAGPTLCANRRGVHANVQTFDEGRPSSGVGRQRVVGDTAPHGEVHVIKSAACVILECVTAPGDLPQSVGAVYVAQHSEFGGILRSRAGGGTEGAGREGAGLVSYKFAMAA